MIVKPELAVFNAGSYPIAEAARLVGAPAAAIRRWLPLMRGSTGLSPSETRAITFAQLIALKVVKRFRDAGVPLPLIEQLRQTAGETLGVALPFATARFRSDGQKLIGSLLAGARGTAANDWAKCKKAFTQTVGPFFQNVDFGRTGDAARFWPLGRKGCIVLDPGRKFGAPIDDESGVPAKAIYAAVMAGGGQEPQRVAEWLDVSLESVRAAVEFEGRLAS